MKFSSRSYMQPTPRNLRKLGDAVLSVALFITAAAIAKDVDVLGYISLFLGGAGKFLTNFFAE